MFLRENVWQKKLAFQRHEFRSGFQIGEPNGDVRKNFATKNAIAAVPALRPPAAGVASAAAQVAAQLLPSVAAMGPAEQTAV